MEPGDVLVGQYHSQNDATEEEHHEHHKEDTLVGGEVKLGLEAEDGDRQTHQGCDPQTQKDRLGIVITGKHPSEISHGEGKDAQQDQIPWEIPPGSRAASKNQVGHKENSIGSPVPSRMCLNVPLDRFAEGEESHNNKSHQELDHQDGINLPDEHPAHIPVIPAEGREHLRVPGVPTAAIAGACAGVDVSPAGVERD